MRIKYILLAVESIEICDRPFSRFENPQIVEND